MDDKTQAPSRIIRRDEVEARTGLGRSTIYERIRNGTFPKPVSLGAKSVGWVEADVNAWIAARIAASRASA